MARRPSPLPESLPWAVVTRAEALRAGVSPRRLRARDIEHVRPGLLARTGRDVSEAEIVSAYCRELPNGVAVGLTAARMQGLPLPSDLEATEPRPMAHLSLPAGRVGSDAVVRWHQFVLSPEEIRASVWTAPPPAGGDAPLHLPARVTTRARTWRDLAGKISSEQLTVIGDHLVRRPRPSLEKGRRVPWASLEELRALCTGRHASALRAALEDVRIGADSPQETRLRLAFARAGLPTPLLNTPLRTAQGRAVHTPDFQWPDQRVCAEYDGRTHSSEDQVARDIRRARRVQKAGWVEVRLSAEDMHDDCAEAVRLVRDALEARRP